MRCWRGILVSGFGFTWNMSWRSWSDEFIERVVAFHVKHCGVGRFASWLFESVASSLLVVGVDVSRGTWKFVWADLLGLVAVALRSGIVFP